MIGMLSGMPRPKYEIGPYLASGTAKLLSLYSRSVSGRMPSAPIDLVRTATSGNFLFDATRRAETT